MVQEILSEKDRQFLKYTLIGSLGIGLLYFCLFYGFIVIETTETDNVTYITNTSFAPWTLWVFEFFLMFIFVLEPLLQKNKRMALITLLVMIVFNGLRYYYTQTK